MSEKKITGSAVSNRDFKGIWIPKEIWLNKDLSLMEKVFLVEINSLDNENGCFASNEYFSKFFGVSKPRCTQIIKSLELKGILKIGYSYKAGTKEIEKRTLKIGSKFSYDGIKNIKRGDKKTKGTCLENAKDNNTLSNNTFNNTDYKGSAGTSTGDKSVFNHCRNYWLTQVHEGWHFNAIQGTALHDIISKLKASIKKSGDQVTDEKIITAFEVMMQALPIWFQDKELNVINSKYNEIVTQIKNSKNGTTNNPRANEYANNPFA